VIDPHDAAPGGEADTLTAGLHVRVLTVDVPAGRGRGSRRSGRAELAQAARFCAVGGSGYLVNLLVFRMALPVLPYLAAFATAFVVSASSNFVWNRLWTFRAHTAPVAGQFLRFLTVSTATLGLDLALLSGLVELGGMGKLAAAAIAIAVVTPISFAGNRLWSFARG